ncbi:MAG TPA: efflux RND transporter periplasmic adaptor subunit [Thermoanaerobaculia bacterium]|nr:efflux RND transporter periplasmic adaptor subunit [Thermoanaerobaculia bacterium]
MVGALVRRKGLIPLVVAILIVAGVGVGLMLRSKAASGGGGDAEQSDDAKSGKSENAAAAGGAGAGKGGEVNGEGKAPVPVRIASIGVAPISSYVSATANLVAEDQVEVLAEAEGRVASLLVEEGESVGRGEALVQLVRGDAEMAAAKARVRAGNAGVAWERAKEMHARGLVSQGDYDRTVMEKEVADQEMAEAEWRLSKTTVRAPFEGVITVRKVGVGQHVRPGDALFTITDFDPLIARIYLPERDVLALSEGREVRLTLRAAEAIRFRGRIRQISPVVDTATGTVKVTVEAVSPPAAVRPGAFVTVDIVKSTRHDATLLPREAVLRELQESHVFIAENGVARKRVVTLGIEEAGRVEVLSGVEAGEQVIVAGQGGLRDGSPVKVMDAPAVKSAAM